MTHGLAPLLLASTDIKPFMVSDFNLVAKSYVRIVLQG
jgi:hypothetical protein